MVVTKHAKKRMKQRCGVGSHTSQKQAAKILRVGLKHSELSGNIKKWVDGIYLCKKTANNIRVYGNQVYLFHNETLITVLNIPSNLIDDLSKIKIQPQTDIKRFRLSREEKYKLCTSFSERLLKLFKSYGFDMYLVGECVRNTILKRPVTKWELRTSADLAGALKILKDAKINCVIYSNNIKITYANCEYNLKSYKGYIEKCADEADLTINGLIYDMTENMVVDCVNGMKDIRRKQIEFVRTASDILDEDHIIAIKTIRTRNELGFQMSNKLTKVCNGRIIENYLTKEFDLQTRNELSKLLSSCNSLDATEELYATLANSYIPELKDTMGCEQNNSYSKYSVDKHTIYTVTFCKDEIKLKWAALLHDIAKPIVKSNKNGADKFVGHAGKSAVMAENILKRLKFQDDFIEEIVFLILYHDKFSRETKIAKVRRFVGEHGRQRVASLIKIMEANSKSHDTESCKGFIKFKQNFRQVCRENSDISIHKLKIFDLDFDELGIYNAEERDSIREELLDQCLGSPNLNNATWLIEQSKRINERHIISKQNDIKYKGID